jgi:hypothetical protein
VIIGRKEHAFVFLPLDERGTKIPGQMSFPRAEREQTFEQFSLESSTAASIILYIG